MRMVTPPKVSSAVLITADPSVTEELFTTALPTPPTSFPVVRMWGLSGAQAGSGDQRAPALISSTTFCAASLLKSFTTTFAPREP
jgi:hypothetical protein